jgi:hypothetical protein
MSMSDERYAIIFRGDITVDQNLAEVKQRLKRLFKADDARIDKLFSGRPVPLKRELSQDEAARYQAVLKQAGAIVAIESMTALKLAASSASSPLAAPSNTSPEAQVSSANPSSEQANWQLAPAGSRLQDKKEGAERIVEIATDHLKVMPQDGNIIKEGERPLASMATVDMDALDWELTPYGEALLKESERASISSAEIDTSNLSVLETSGDLLKDAERPKLKPVEVDISGLSMAEMEGNLIKDTEKPETPSVSVDTSHLRLMPDD